MAATHRILDDFYDESFSLFALHSSLEDYAIAYSLNRQLKTRFRRLPKDLDIARGVSFPIFEWKDLVNDKYWTLISNICRKEDKSGSEDLFINEPSHSTYYLLPEYKDVDYVIKIEGEPAEAEMQLPESLADIPGLIAAYALDTNKLKSKKNLIF
jgi:hypothetical protein